MAMRHRVFAHLAAGLLVPFLLAPIAAAQSTWRNCGNKGNYTANSTYQSNLAQLAATIPKNASAFGALFATGSVGSVPDIVNALTLCRGDIDASACEACVGTAFQDAQQLCAFNKDASVFYDLCYLRFSNQNFLVPTSNGDPSTLLNLQNVSSPVEVFDHAVRVLLNATADYAAAKRGRRASIAVIRPSTGWRSARRTCRRRTAGAASGK